MTTWPANSVLLNRKAKLLPDLFRPLHIQKKKIGQKVSESLQGIYFYISNLRSWCLLFFLKGGKFTVTSQNLSHYTLSENENE